MKKTALLFPGQGSQYVGMGQQFHDGFEESRSVFETAVKQTGIFVDELCFQGPAETLKETMNSQLCILTVSLAGYEALKTLVPDFSPDYAAGLSLGEYTALSAAGVLSVEEVLSLVKSRAQIMTRACQDKPGTMVSVLGLDEGAVAGVCQEISGFCSIANYNCPGQIVISCDKSIVSEVIEKAKSAGARRSMEIPVAGAFHSEYKHKLTKIFYFSRICKHYMLISIKNML